jgi:KaiC/GvpD/RAD55 family RecA-like ATPase
VSAVPVASETMPAMGDTVYLVFDEADAESHGLDASNVRRVSPPISVLDIPTLNGASFRITPLARRSDDGGRSMGVLQANRYDIRDLKGEPLFPSFEGVEYVNPIAEVDAPKTALPLIWACDAGPMLDAPYVVKGIIGPGELIVVYGAPKSGKTFFATDLGLHVAAGMLWFGHRVNPGLVLYIASEMGKRAERRVKAWIDERLGDAAAAPPFALVPKVVNLLDDLDVERLVATIESLVATRGKPALLIVDTLARSMAGGDENSAQDMGRAIAVADRLRDQFSTATVLVHHAGKDVTKGGRGSSALLGAADTYILVESDQAGGHVATVEWSRDGEAGQRYGFRLPVVELGTDADGDRITTCVVEACAAVTTKTAKPVRRDVALDALRETIGEHATTIQGSSTIPAGVKVVTLDQWKARWLLRTGYDEGRIADSHYCHDKADLLKSGAIGVSKPYVWIN